MTAIPAIAFRSHDIRDLLCIRHAECCAAGLGLVVAGGIGALEWPSLCPEDDLDLFIYHISNNALYGSSSNTTSKVDHSME